MSTFYGVIRPGTPTGRPAGWYYCEPSACAPQVGSASFQVSGVSIKADVLAEGDEVDIISVGDWSQYSMEFGFIKRSARHGSVYGTPDSARAQLIATEPASCALAWLANKAGKARTWYRVATVSNLLVSELRVVDRVTGEPSVVPVSSDLDVDDFQIGELVLVETITTARVIGWWEPRMQRYVGWSGRVNVPAFSPDPGSLRSAVVFVAAGVEFQYLFSETEYIGECGVGLFSLAPEGSLKYPRPGSYWGPEIGGPLDFDGGIGSDFLAHHHGGYIRFGFSIHPNRKTPTQLQPFFPVTLRIVSGGTTEYSLNVADGTLLIQI